MALCESELCATGSSLRLGRAGGGSARGSSMRGSGQSERVDAAD